MSTLTTSTLTTSSSYSASFLLENVSFNSKVEIIQMKMLIDSASHLTSYSDYTARQVESVFASDGNKELFKVLDPVTRTPLGCAIVKHLGETERIEFMFTLPAGGRQNLIMRTLTQLRDILSQRDPKIRFIEINTWGFPWISGSAIALYFQPSTEPNIYRINVLHFNHQPVTICEPNSLICSATESELKAEPTFEHAPYHEAIKSGGRCLLALINQMKVNGYLSDDETERMRIDVRGVWLRQGQLQNPPGKHCDFLQMDDDQRWIMPQPQDALKIIMVNTGGQGTRFFTQPISVCSVPGDKWYRLLREPVMFQVLTETTPKSFMTENGRPVIFDDTTIHEAMPLVNQSFGYRLMIRCIVYPPSRVNEVPTQGESSLPQVYMLSRQEM